MALGNAQLSSYKTNINLEALHPFKNRVKRYSVKFSVQCHCSTTLHDSPTLSKEAELIKALTDRSGDGNVNAVAQRNVIRLGLPSKGRMADGALSLLQNCQLGVRQVNPRQYVAHVPEGHEELILVHDALGFGKCRLSLAIPNDGVYKNICTLGELATMPQWTTEKPLRIATGYTHLGKTFAKEKGLKHVTFSTADGALEAAPAVIPNLSTVKV